MGRGSIYHEKGVRYTLDRESDIPWVGGSKYHGYGGHNTMGTVVTIPCIGGQTTMGRGSICHG